MAFLARELTNGYGLSIDSVSPSTARKVFELVAEGETNEAPYINWDTAVEDFLNAGDGAAADPDGVDTMAFVVGDPFSTARPELKVRGYSVVPYPMNRKKCRIIVRYSTRTTSFSGGPSRRASVRQAFREIVVPTYWQTAPMSGVWVQGADHKVLRAQWVYRRVTLQAEPVFLEAIFAVQEIFNLEFLRIGYELDLLANNQWARSEMFIYEGQTKKHRPDPDAFEIPDIPPFKGIVGALLPSGPKYQIQEIDEVWGEQQNTP